MVGKGGIGLRKGRELATAVVCICLVVGVALLEAGRLVPASGLSQDEGGNPILILDAGHGGEDGGAVSASGAKESEINLAIVRKLEALMAFLGVPTVLTREEDISLHESGCQSLREKKASDLRQRVSLVNETPNAMLISVHQNHFTDSRYYGAQVFYNPGDVSRQWGSTTQQALRQVLDENNQREAMALSNSVYLFQHIVCPAILVECGFLSNGEEASLLVTDAYQRKIAVALAGACFQELRLLD